MIKSIIVDDEVKSSNALKMQLEAYCPQVEIVAIFNDPKKAVIEIPKLNPDLLFLDIQMPGLTGFDLLSKLKSIDFHIIFVTAYDEYAVKAFEFNAVDYIMKPVRKSKLIEAVSRVEDEEASKLDTSRFEALLTNLRIGEKKTLETLAIPTTNGYEIIHINQINYLMAQNNYTWVYQLNGDKYLVSKPLKHLVEMIDNPNFFRVHKSYFVNMLQVKRLIRGAGHLILKDETEIPIARARKEQVLQRLNI